MAIGPLNYRSKDLNKILCGTLTPWYCDPFPETDLQQVLSKSAGEETNMATDAIATSAFGKNPLYRPVNRTAERFFYSGMAVLLCVCVFIGFSPTYYQAGMLSAPLPSPILHIHGAVFTLWMLLFVVAFISARRVKWHRSFGTVAFCLPPVMVVLGVMAAVDALHRGVRIGPLDPSVSAAIPLISIIGFAIPILASWRARRRPDAHKRLILIATIALAGAAFGRFPWSRIGLPPSAGAYTGVGCLLLILIIYDLLSLHRVHRSTMWAAPLAFLTIFLAVPIGFTHAWHAFAALLN
jgi:uncharacterized membrane protein YozB (DUF420 family)